MNQQGDFAQANRAFDLFTLAERAVALEIFAGLQYPSLVDRFHEAVYRVIRAQNERAAVVPREEPPR